LNTDPANKGLTGSDPENKGVTGSDSDNKKLKVLAIRATRALRLLLPWALSVGDGSGWEKHGVGSNGKPSLMGLGLSETTLYIYFTNSGEITSIG